MANIKSAIKRIRTAETKRVANKTRLSRVRTFIKKVEAAVLAGDAAAAEAAFKALQPEIQRAQAKGTLHKKKVARTLSRLSGHVKGTKTKTKAA
jgi:small subunit ribosomal protein S20